MANAMLWQGRAAAAPRPEDSDVGRPAPRGAYCRGPFPSPAAGSGSGRPSVQRKLWAGRGTADLLRAPGRGRRLRPVLEGGPTEKEGPGCGSRDGALGHLCGVPRLRGSCLSVPLSGAPRTQRRPTSPSCRDGVRQRRAQPASASPHGSGGSSGNAGAELSSAEPPGADAQLPAALPALPACACGTCLGMNVAKRGGSAPVRSRHGERHTRPCALSRGWPGWRHGAARPWSWGSPRRQRWGRGPGQGDAKSARAKSPSGAPSARGSGR